MTNKKYSRTIRDIKLLLNTLPKGVEDFTLVIENECADYFEIEEIDYEDEIVSIYGYYLNYN